MSEVFSKKVLDTITTAPNFYCKIQLEGEPDLRTPLLFRMSVEELHVAKTYIDENRAKGFIELSDSPLRSLILITKKPGGGLRFYVDYRKLNAVTKKNRYPLPLINKTLAKLKRVKQFSKIDVRQAFYKIWMYPDSKDLTTFRTRYGLYRYNIIPFGLYNGPSTFQHYINDALIGYLDRYYLVFIDDILIYSKLRKEYRKYVCDVLDRLQKIGLQADLKKCEFEVTETKFLRLIVLRDGIKMDLAKIQAILNQKVPKTVKGVQSFLGLCNYYRRFIRGYLTIARPLTRLTYKDQTQDQTPRYQKAFNALKEAIRSDPVLRHFDPTKIVYIKVDFSDYISGGIIMQKDENGKLYPVAYFSKKLNPAEYNYTIYNKELLAIIRAFKEQRPEYLNTNAPIQVFTDYETLKNFIQTK